MDRRLGYLLVLFFALALAGCVQYNPLANDCEKNGGTCRVMGDFAVDTCEMHNLTTLPYPQSCPHLAVNTQCCGTRQVVCTMEALQCPDGSYVGRTGPNCEFTPCPNCTCPQGYIQDGNVCNPICYYSTPKCLTPSMMCNRN